jgi:pyruvate carboxylase subunit B
VRYTVDVNGSRHEVVVAGGIATVGGTDFAASIESSANPSIRLILIGDAVHRVIVRRGDRRGRYTISLGGFRFEIDALDERSRAIQDLANTAAEARGPAPLVAPMPGLIVRVNVAVGDAVQAGAGLVVMEAMKMENELRAPAAGRVRAVSAVPGKAVEKGMVLVELE